MLTERQREQYAAEGLIRLPGAVSAAEVERMADRVREHVATRGAEKFQPLTKEGAFDAIGDSTVTDALDILHPGWQRPAHWGRVLYTPPSGTEWDLPADGWHLDLPAAENGEPRWMTVFTVLAPLRTRGGGTLVLTGSHRLAVPGTKSREQRRAAGRRSSWLHALWHPDLDRESRRARYLDQVVFVDGIALRVVELTGEPGDVYLMRADTFHAAAPNALAEPRIMLVKGLRLSAT